TASSAVLDAVSYEGSTTWTSVIPNVPAYEGGAGSSFADSNTASMSLCRTTNGSDTNSNTTDFNQCNTPTPGAFNVP
ncbi:MAG: hypothetical protein JNM17_04660, partial [Archangium sp.]|nr:hypothetical protein [Archangium sp.]